MIYRVFFTSMQMKVAAALLLCLSRVNEACLCVTDTQVNVAAAMPTAVPLFRIRMDEACFCITGTRLNIAAVLLLLISRVNEACLISCE